MKNDNLVKQNYKMFCGFEGSDFIASEFALKVILKIIKKYNITNVLELGLGIGSISDTVLKDSKNAGRKINYVGTEKNEFCLNALKKNVRDYVSIELFSELNHIKNKKFQLIIIDGYDDTLNQIVSFCDENAIIFIEGDRKGQTNTILEIFPNHKYVNVISLNKNKPYGHGECKPNNYVGGGQLIFINPTLKMKLFWFKEKIATFIIRKIRLLEV